MKIISELSLKHIFVIALTLLVGAPGVVGVYVTLFPPSGVQLALSHIVIGLGCSFVFLLIAWAIWMWSKTCLLCQTNHLSSRLHH